MRTKTINLYQFNELSEEAREKAIENLWDINVNYDWWEFTYDDIQQVGETLGIIFTNPGKEFFFSLDRNYHFSFRGSLDFETMCKKWPEFKESYPTLVKTFSEVPELMKKGKRLLKWDFGEVWTESDGDGQYHGFNTWNFDGYEDNNVRELLEDLGEDMEDLMEAFRDWALNRLRAEYDYLTDEERVIESIESNEYEFTEDGEMA